MELKWQENYLKQLEETFAGITDMNEIIEEDGIKMIRSGFTLFEGSDAGVVTRGCLLDVLPNYNVLDVYMVIASGLPDDNIEEIEKLCNKLNYYSVAGSFGVYKEGNELYLKNDNTIDVDKDYETLAMEAVMIYTTMLTTVKNAYKAIVDVNNGAKNAEEAINDYLS